MNMDCEIYEIGCYLRATLCEFYGIKCKRSAVRVHRYVPWTNEVCNRMDMRPQAPIVHGAHSTLADFILTKEKEKGSHKEKRKSERGDINQMKVVGS